MRTFAFAVLLGIATGTTAQDQAKPQEPDKDEQTRIRTERSAGGLGKITPEERANANVGAGPHMERRTGAARRDPREDPGEQSARGGTQGEGVESKDAPREPNRR